LTPIPRAAREWRRWRRGIAIMHSGWLQSPPARLGLREGHDPGTQRAHHVLDISAPGWPPPRAEACCCFASTIATRWAAAAAARGTRAAARMTPNRPDAKETHARTIARFGNNVKELLGIRSGDAPAGTLTRRRGRRRPLPFGAIWPLPRPVREFGSGLTERAFLFPLPELPSGKPAERSEGEGRSTVQPQQR